MQQGDGKKGEKGDDFVAREYGFKILRHVADAQRYTYPSTLALLSRSIFTICKKRKENINNVLIIF